VYQSSQVYQDCINSVPIVKNSQKLSKDSQNSKNDYWCTNRHMSTKTVPTVYQLSKTVKTAKITIGVPIVTCVHTTQSPLNTQSLRPHPPNTQSLPKWQLGLVPTGSIPIKFRSMYPSISKSFRVIRCLIQCVTPKIGIFTTFLFPLGTPLAQSCTLNVVWMEREFDAYKLPRCMCPSNRF